MTLTKSLLSVFAALALSSGAAFAGDALSHDALESGDRAYFAESEGAMTDPITTANSGEMMDYDVYYIVPMEVVEVEEIWLVPSIDSEHPLG
jgi:hypothetical protein